MNIHSWNLEERAIAIRAVEEYRVNQEVQKSNAENDARRRAEKPDKCPGCGGEPMSWDYYCVDCYAWGTP